MSRPSDGGSGAIVLDSGTANDIRERFNDLSAEFENARAPLRGQYSSIVAACGEFSGAIDDGAAKFLLSWHDVFDVTSTEAALIAGNVNNFSVDLQAFDRDSSTSISL
jgi:hypothetical protein